MIRTTLLAMAVILVVAVLAVMAPEKSRPPSAHPGGTPGHVAGKALPHRGPAPSGSRAASADSRPVCAPGSAVPAYPHPMMRYLESLDGDQDYDLEVVVKRFAAHAGILPRNERGRLLVAVARWFAMRRPEDALRFMNRLETSIDRAQFSGEFLGHVLVQSPAAAAEWVQQVSEEVLAAYLHERLARRWARSDLQAALEWARRLPASAYQAEALQGIAFTWTQQDPDAALKWAADIAQEGLQDRIFAKMVKVFALENPALAARWASELPASRDIAGALHYAVHHWVAEDFDPAMEWVLALPEPGLQDVALRAAAGAWGQMASRQAADWFAEWPDEELRAGSLTFIVADWSRRDPAGTVNWLQEAPGLDRTLRDSLLEGVFHRLAAKDEVEARQLMGALRSSHLRAIAEAAVSAHHDPADDPADDPAGEPEERTVDPPDRSTDDES